MSPAVPDSIALLSTSEIRIARPLADEMLADEMLDT
jgi:hypothetical protein